jgi:transposase InsO family protein
MKEYSRRFGLERMCKTLGVSRSGYYSYKSRSKSKREKEREKLLKEIRIVFQASRELYGSPRITAVLLSQGIACNKKRISRIMRSNGIKAKTVRKYKATTNSKHKLPIANNLLNQKFEVKRPNKVWTGDITYIWTKKGWLYLAVVLDLYSRRVVGWHIDKYMTKELVIKALDQAVINRRLSGDILFHSDQGIQYASNEFRSVLNKVGIEQSMSRKGNCYDNAVSESFFHTLKTELVYFEKYDSREDAKLSIFEYIEVYYNRKRIHSSIGYKSPAQFENEFMT